MDKRSNCLFIDYLVLRSGSGLEALGTRIALVLKHPFIQSGALEFELAGPGWPSARDAILGGETVDRVRRRIEISGGSRDAHEAVFVLKPFRLRETGDDALDQSVSQRVDVDVDGEG